MKTVCGIQFRTAGRIYTFECADMADVGLGSEVIVETELGLGLGKIVCAPYQMEDSEAPKDLKKVVRTADRADFEREDKNRDREKSAFETCLKFIKQKNLDMKLVKVEYFYDASKAIFFFSAEHRVDFRELVRDLARALHTRIEMKQIGVRDETKMLGGIGCCGQPVCCSMFLREFQPVSVKMAKEQNLAMNPTKISGLCGRLMCCLGYEHCAYEDMSRDLPKKGKVIETPDGPARVVDVNVLKRLVTLSTENGGTFTVPVDKLPKFSVEDNGNEEPEDDLSDIPPPEVAPLGKPNAGSENNDNNRNGGMNNRRNRNRPNTPYRNNGNSN